MIGLRIFYGMICRILVNPIHILTLTFFFFVIKIILR